MNIRTEYLQYVFNLHSVHQPSSIEGTYDGIDGELILTFNNDPETYTIEFVYTGSSHNGFREVLCQAAGEAVKQHNYNIGIPNRDEFIESVTE